ncbi:MAG: hypothetical protein K2N13_09740 [Paraprevotella sp.]|nr:hypothetical protein [Paraprevotella sp.]
MKKNYVKGIAVFLSVMFLALLCPGRTMAQQKVTDKDIIGVWIMTSFKYDGEDRNYICDSYNQVKIYCADGAYACAEIIRDRKGRYVIYPHEYGTYSFKNGKYIEMGRDATDLIKMTSKTTFKGRWQNRYDEWKKVTDMPEKLTRHILEKCKAAQESPEDIQKLMERYIMKNHTSK